MLAETIASVGVLVAIAFIGLHYQLTRIANALEKANQITNQNSQTNPITPARHVRVFF